MNYQNLDWQKIFHKPVCQLDEQHCFIHQTTADLDIYAQDGTYLMPANCVDSPIPETKTGYAAQWQLESQTWQYIEDYRGQTAYDTETGKPIHITELGALTPNQTLKPKPSEYHIFNHETGNWNIDNDLRSRAEQQQFQAAQNTKLAELNTAAQNYIAKAAGTDKVPEFELQSWSLQALEAKAWAADKSAATPILDTIATNRKIPREALIQAALNKTLQYEALTAAVAGQRQALQTRIEKAKNIDDLNAIEIVFTLPESE
ncbi:tail fiber assembly protein [Neisseriaceae bacterium B1]